MALRWGEYRESVDIDFLVSHQPGYRELRHVLTNPEGLEALARPGATLRQMRAARADQYGIRTLVEADGVPIKLEIEFEARITLEAPSLDDQICGVPCLTPLDLATSKLLANADRWADDGIHNRNLIDLAMMQPSRDLLARAFAKAEAAYGVRAALHKAVDHLLKREGRLEHNMRSMQMTLPRALVLQRIRTLMRRVPPSPSGTPVGEVRVP